ncbi:hypothetical protein K8942_05800 [Candidatus Peribacteria bacterium]|nr:MAG: hypothetical protein K8942_05800 [Candidatus Peribacteria bacterium]
MSPELNDADTGAHSNEVPMPQEKTGDIQPNPAEPPHMPGPDAPDNNPAHPASDRA